MIRIPVSVSILPRLVSGRRGIIPPLIYTSQARLILISIFSIFVPIGCNLNSFSTIITDKTSGFNGSFEFVKDGLPVNWFIYKPTTDTAQTKLVFDTLNPPDGKQFLKFNIYNCSNIGGWHSPGIFQETDVKPGKTYQVSFRIKNQGCKYMIRMDCFTAGIEDPNHPKKWISFSDSIPDWQKFSYEFTFSNELNRFRFELNLLSPGTLCIDDVRIEEKKP